MDIKIQSLHFTARPELQNFTLDRVGKISHLNGHALSADVCLKTEKSGEGKNKICEISLHVPGEKLFAKEQCATFEEAIDLSASAIERQLRSRKK